MERLMKIIILTILLTTGYANSAIYSTLKAGAIYQTHVDKSLNKSTKLSPALEVGILLGGVPRKENNLSLFFSSAFINYENNGYNNENEIKIQTVGIRYHTRDALDFFAMEVFMGYDFFDSDDTSIDSTGGVIGVAAVTYLSSNFALIIEYNKHFGLQKDPDENTNKPYDLTGCNLGLRLNF
jgi:hypothetical protein